MTNPSKDYIEGHQAALKELVELLIKEVDEKKASKKILLEGNLRDHTEITHLNAGITSLSKMADIVRSKIDTEVVKEER